MKILALTVALSATLSATTIQPGGTVSAIDTVTPTGTLIATRSAPLVTIAEGGGSVLTTGSLYSAVYLQSDGGYTFAYQLNLGAQAPRALRDIQVRYSIYTENWPLTIGESATGRDFTTLNYRGSESFPYIDLNYGPDGLQPGQSTQQFYISGPEALTYEVYHNPINATGWIEGIDIDPTPDGIHMYTTEVNGDILRPALVPEPGTFALLGAGLIAAALARKRSQS